MGVSLAALYSVCWLPYWLLQWSIELDIGWTKNTNLLIAVSHIAYTLQYLNSALNPFLYFFFTESFRSNFKLPAKSFSCR